MLILAFDTTSEKGGVGVFQSTKCLALVPNEGPANQYSITLFEMVEQALSQAHLELCEIELFAAANGPGSFTGIRVGLAAALAWGKAFGRRVRGVSVLEAMVNMQGRGTRDSGLGETPTSEVGRFEIQESPASLGGGSIRRTGAGEGALPSQKPLGPDWYFPILDARRGEFFLGSFRRTLQTRASGASSEAAALHTMPAKGRDYEPADGGWVFKPELLRAYLEEQLTTGASATCLVRAHDQAATDLHGILPAALNWQTVEGMLVGSIAEIALKEEELGCPDLKLDAYYIRRPDAEIHWKD